MDKRVLVVGASGLVGSAILNQLNSHIGINAVGTYYSQAMGREYEYMDLNSIKSIVDVMNRVRPNVVFLAGGNAHVNDCEINSESYRTNVEAVKVIVRLAQGLHSNVIFYSTSYVFDGSSSTPYTIYDRPMPVNTYGIQKMNAEREVLTAGGTVIRTVAVFGREWARKNYAYQIIDKLALGKRIESPQDQLVSPIYSDDLAISSVHIMDAGLRGVIHLSGSECVSKYQFAMDIAEKFGLCGDSIIPTKTVNNVRGIANRPLNSCLAPSIPPNYNYHEALEKFLNDN